MLTRRGAGAALLACCAGVPTARAQGFPDQPIRLIVPFAAGGPADTVARLIGRVMAQRLGQPVVVESRSGAGGVVGVEAVARSRPDGHTIVLASTGAMVALPHMMPRMPYDPLRDLAPVSLVIRVPIGYLVRAARAGWNGAGPDWRSTAVPDRRAQRR